MCRALDPVICENFLYINQDSVPPPACGRLRAASWPGDDDDDAVRRLRPPRRIVSVAWQQPGHLGLPAYPLIPGAFACSRKLHRSGASA